MPQIVSLPNDTKNKVENLYNGSLAGNINKNMRYVSTGIIIGAAAGIIFASIFGKCRLCYGVLGGIAGGGIGYATAKK